MYPQLSYLVTISCHDTYSQLCCSLVSFCDSSRPPTISYSEYSKVVQNVFSNVYLRSKVDFTRATRKLTIQRLSPHTVYCHAADSRSTIHERHVSTAPYTTHSFVPPLITAARKFIYSDSKSLRSSFVRSYCRVRKPEPRAVGQV